MKSDTRRVEIDIVKGIGIILMIFAHIFIESPLDKWIHSFHMPMFFVISGFLYKKKQNVKNDILNKTKTIIIPYLFISIFHLIVFFSKEIITNGNISTSIQYLKNIFWINHENIAICGAVWFLTAFYVANIIVILIEYYIKNLKIKTLIYSLITIIGITLARLNVILPFSICQGLVGVGFFYIGIIINQLKNKLNSKVLYGILGLIIGTIISQLNNPINMRMMKFENEIMFFASATIITLSLLTIVGKFKDSNNILNNELAYIGENSIIYLGFNQVLIFAINNIIPWKVMELILVLILIRLFSILVNKSKFKWLLGKK